MRYKEFLNEGVVGDFVSGVKQGYGSGGAMQPVKRQKRSPYDIVSPDVMKEIIELVLSGKPINYQQQSLLKKLYQRL